jgi:CHAT domain-containing protein/tetratricopeptide (TPR) repeat protein
VKRLLGTALLLCALAVAARGAADAAAVDAHARPGLLTAGVLDRLAALLDAIPRTWEGLASPLVPVSKRPLEEVLAVAGEEPSREASRWLARLASTPAGARAALIQAEIRRRPLTEVDVWLPGALVHRVVGLDDAALLEAWMQWAGALGRKDALLAGAAAAIHVLCIRTTVAAVAPIAREWAALPAVAGAERSEAWLQSSLAEVYVRLGDETKALAAYQAARDLLLAAGDRLGQGEAWNGEAEVLLGLGEMRRAKDAYDEAQTLLRAERQRILAGAARPGSSLAAWQRLRVGDAWYGEALILFRLGETTRVNYACGEARHRFRAAGDQLGEAKTWHLEAGAYLRHGEHRRAAEAYRQARELFMAVGDHAGAGNTWLGEAVAWQSMPLHPGVPEDRGDARGAAAAAADEYRIAGLVPSQVSALLLEGSLDSYRRKSDPVFKAIASALGFAHPCAAEIEAIRLHPQELGTLITDRLRTEREEKISAAYDCLVPQRAGEKGHVVEALQLAEEARSRVLLDLLAAPPDRGESGSAADLVAERQRLQAESWRLEALLRESPPLDRQVRLLDRRLHLDQDLEWNHYRRLAAQNESFAREQPLDAPAMEHLAAETGPILVYYVAAAKVWGFLILPRTAEIRVRSIAIPRYELGRRIRAFSRDLANPLFERRTAPRDEDRRTAAPRSWREQRQQLSDLYHALFSPTHERPAEIEARDLWDLLIAPFADLLPASGRLVLVPHGALHELPFEALRDARGKWLFERWDVSTTPSVSALAIARRGHATSLAGDSFLGLSSGRGLTLPVAEVAEVASLFGTGTTAFQPTAATYSNYQDRAAQGRHLLIATRGVHRQGSRSETYLEIEPTPELHDSRLTAAEIATIPLHAELVTLAACDTSHGRALLSDERLDLTRSFLIAHAAAVLATRWKVPEDAVTGRFLADFYRAYRRGGPEGTGLRKDEALTEARRRSLGRGDPAQVWAAWVLVGDAR